MLNNTSNFNADQCLDLISLSGPKAHSPCNHHNALPDEGWLHPQTFDAESIYATVISVGWLVLQLLAQFRWCRSAKSRDQAN